IEDAWLVQIEVWHLLKEIGDVVKGVQAILLGGLMAWIYYDALLAVPPANLNRSLGGYQPEIPITWESMLNANGRRRSAIRMRMWRVFREFDRTGEERIRAVYEKIDRWSRLALQALSNHELLQHLQDVMNEGVAFAPASMCA